MARTISLSAPQRRFPLVLLVLPVLLVPLPFASSCSDSSGGGLDAGADTDTDTDTDTDSDSDSDSDTGTDTDTDSDTDSDADSDTDTDTDSDTDADAGTDTDSDSDTDYDAGPDTDAGLTFDELCDAFVEDLCTSLIDCYGASWGWVYADMDHCMADHECMGMVALEADVAAGWVEYDPVAAQECHEAFAADPCGFGDFIFEPSVYGVLETCGDVLAGQQGIGAPCASDADCAPAGRCEPEGECPGTCEQWPQEGDGCTDYLFSGDDCDPSLDLVCYSSTCTPPVLVGESCADAPCADDLWCDSDEICAEPLSEGEVCEWLDSSCAEGLWCDALPSEPGVCQPPGEIGDPCGANDDHCVPPLVCVPTTAELGDPGTCEAGGGGVGAFCNSSADCAEELCCDSPYCIEAPGLGEACFGWPGECAAELVCEEDVCLTAAFPGESCTEPMTACVLSLCDGTVCQYKASLGESCLVDDECASDACDGVCVDDYGCTIE